MPHPEKYITTSMRQSSWSQRHRGRRPESPILQVFPYSPTKPLVQPLWHPPGSRPRGLGSRELDDPGPQHPSGGQPDTALCGDAPG